MPTRRRVLALGLLLTHLALWQPVSQGEGPPSLNGSILKEYNQPASLTPVSSLIETRTIVIPADTVINVTLSAPLNTSRTLLGESVTAAVTEPVYIGPFLTIPKGSMIQGRVIDINKTPQKHGPNPYVVVNFDGLQRLGESVPLAFNGQLIAYKTGLQRKDYVWRLPQKKDRKNERWFSALEGASYGIMVNPLFGAPAGAAIGVLKTVLTDHIAQKGSVKITNKEEIPISVRKEFNIPILEAKGDSPSNTIGPPAP